MPKSKEDLAKYTLRTILGIVRYEDDIPQARIDEVIGVYDLVYAELLAEDAARIIVDCKPVIYLPNEIPEQIFHGLCSLVGARCAPMFSVDDPPDEMEAMRWIYAKAEIPKTRPVRMRGY